MPYPPSRPVFVIVPGASQSPAHYAQITHLLQTHGYPVLSALLPTMGTGENVTVQDDTDYVIKHMLIPVLDVEKHDVILVTHSYSGVPGGAAAAGFGKKDRLAKGKTTSVLGQIYISAILARGGDGNDIFTTFGGQLPPHLQIDEARGLITCEDPAPPIYGDVTPKKFQDALVLSTMNPSLASFKSPAPRASWDEDAFEGRVAFIRTLKDAGVSAHLQDMLIASTGVEWIVKDVESGHSPQIVAPEKTLSIFLELAKHFETL